MNLYFKIWWLSLVSLLVGEVLVGSIFQLKLDTSIIIIFILIFLPLINILVQEVKKDFFSLGFWWDWRTLIKWIILIIYGIISHTYGFTLLNSMVGFYFVFSVLFVFESRVSFLIALIFLAFCPILLITDSKTLAETFAILAYYFLCIGVFTQILEFKFNKNEQHDA